MLAGSRVLQIWCICECVACTVHEWIIFASNEPFHCVYWKRTKTQRIYVYSMILHDQEYDHRPKIYIREERERKNHFKILSHVCEHARRASTRLDSPRMPWLAPTSIRQATGSIHIEEASRVQHNVQTCYWNSLSWDFAECASWIFFSSQLMLLYALSVCNIKCVFYVRGLACVQVHFSSHSVFIYWTDS